MKNYYIRELGDFKKERPDPKTCTFKTLQEYRKAAKKIIQTFAPKNQVKTLLGSEDYITDVCFALMSRDWDFNKSKGRTDYSWRNNGGLWGIKDCLSSSQAVKNQEKNSLDMQFEDGGKISDMIEDKNAKDPLDVIAEIERKERVKDYLNWLMDNSDLSTIQRKVLTLRFVEDMESAEEIAKSFNPPVSRQDIAQILERAIAKLQLTANGASE